MHAPSSAARGRLAGRAQIIRWRAPTDTRSMLVLNPCLPSRSERHADVSTRAVARVLVLAVRWMASGRGPRRRRPGPAGAAPRRACCGRRRSGGPAARPPAAQSPPGPESAVRGSVRADRDSGLRHAPVVAASYCSTTLAGMRPRSLTAMPCSFAHARMSPLRSRLDGVRTGRRRCPRPALRACSM